VTYTESTTRSIGVRGTIARPAPSPTIIPDEEPLNGLEEVVRWDDLEEALAEGKFAYKADFKAEVISQFEQAGMTFTRSLYESAIAGLDPEHREMYRDLPAAMPSISSKLTEEIVREIRERASKGEKALHLAKEFGVRHNTVGDLIKRKTWRNVA
jgi:hypothetical protein